MASTGAGGLQQLLHEADVAQQRLAEAEDRRAKAQQLVQRATAAEAESVAQARAEAARIVKQVEEKAAAVIAAAKKTYEAATEMAEELQAVARQKAEAAALKAAQDRQAALDRQRGSHLAPLLLPGLMGLVTRMLEEGCDKCVPRRGQQRCPKAGPCLRRRRGRRPASLPAAPSLREPANALQRPRCPSFGCRGALVRTCKALHRNFLEQPADWLRGLHLRLEPANTGQLAACQRRVQKLLELPQPIQTRITLKPGTRKVAEGQLMELAGSLRQGLLALVAEVAGAPTGPPIEFPLLESAQLTGRGRSGVDLTSGITFTTRLQSVELADCGLLRLPQSLTHLRLLNVNVAAEAAPAIVAGKSAHPQSHHPSTIQPAATVARL